MKGVTNMKRLVVTGPKQVEFEEISIPKCLDNGLLVKSVATAVSTGTELRVYRWIPVDEQGTMLHGGVPFPDGPTENGYSMVGEVVEIGNQVSGFRIGERVFLSGTHKEYESVLATDVFKIPDSIPTEQAVMLNILHVGHVALRTGQPIIGENIAVVGLGVIGQSVVAWCKAFGFTTAGIDIETDRLSIARARGANIAISPSDERFIPEIGRVFNNEGADLAIEAASTWKAIETSMDIVRTRGKVVVIARHTDQPHYNLVGHPYLSKQITLRTAYGTEDTGQRWDRDHCFRLAIDMLDRGDLSIDPMITHHISYKELPDMYRKLDEGNLGILGIVVNWT